MKDQVYNETIPRTTWRVPLSNFAKKTFNPIRNIVENMKIEPHPDKQMIALSIGDPTVFGNLKLDSSIVEAVVTSVRSGKYNGYAASTGHQDAKEAIAKYMSCPGAPVSAKDVIICSGCSCSLDLCISALCESNTTMLVPRPGFPLYSTLAEGLGIRSKFYNLLPEKNWEIDLDHLESLIDETTSAIVLNNPSNPCGSVFSLQHLEDFAAIAVKHKIPVIADEIYDHFVFQGHEYHPVASVNHELPVLACGGLTKRFLVPGWRTGWIAIHDRGGVLSEISEGLKLLSQRIIGSNTLVQGALPAILQNTPRSFFDTTLCQVQRNALRAFATISSIKGLKPTPPQGAMYMMVEIDMKKFPDYSTDLQFVEAMVSEQSVFCLPGKCFNIPNFFRIVLTVPEDKLTEACERMAEFCKEHYIETVPKQFGEKIKNSFLCFEENDCENKDNGSCEQCTSVNGPTGAGETNCQCGTEMEENGQHFNRVHVNKVYSLKNDFFTNLNGVPSVQIDLVDNMDCDP